MLRRVSIPTMTALLPLHLLFPFRLFDLLLDIHPSAVGSVSLISSKYTQGTLGHPRACVVPTHDD